MSINGYFNDRIATHIHDELHARCLVLDDSQTRLAIVVCDSCMIPRAVMDAAKELIRQRAGIAVDHVLISAPHTRTPGRPASAFSRATRTRITQNFSRTRIADGVQRAVNNLAPAKIGWGVAGSRTRFSTGAGT